MPTYMWEEPTTHEVAYLIGYVDIAGTQPAKARLDAAVNGLVTKMGKPKTQKDVTFAGMLGRELVIEAGAMELTYRIFVKGDRLYTLGAAHAAATKVPFEPKKFLDSLVIAK